MSITPAIDHLTLHLRRLLFVLELDGEESAKAGSLATIERALSRLESSHSSEDGEALPLVSLAQRFGLSDAECDLILIAAAPAIDATWREIAERECRYGKMDVAFAVRALEARGMHPLAALEVLAPNARLRRNGLVELFTLGKADAAHLLSYRIQVPLRVSHFLLGRRVLDETLTSVAALRWPQDSFQEVLFTDSQGPVLAQQIARWQEQAVHARAEGHGSAFVAHLRGPSGVGKTSLTRAVAHSLGLAVIEIDCTLLQAIDAQTATQTVTHILFAAQLLDAIAVFDRIDELIRGGPALAALRDGIENVAAVVVFIGTAELPDTTGLAWRSLTEIRLSPPEADEREAIWKRVLEGHALETDVEAGLLAHQYPLSGAQIHNAAADASLRAAPTQPLSQTLLADASSHQMRADLSEFARPRTTKLTLQDLVLPPSETEAINEIISACRQRAAVLHRWGFRKRLDYGTGIVALFSGEPGTGKTLCARIIAETVGMNLYQIAIPSIVSKWIGETERNISQIFQRATASQAILLFDEADSLLAARTEVRDATDRYANMSTNQLLQEIEAFEGIVLLTTNLAQNLDPAAERRILFRVNFPFPGQAEREELWRRLLPPEAISPDMPIDFEDLGEHYEISGGHIKNAILRGAYAAMERGGPITTEVLGLAAEKECKAIGKLVRGGW